MPNLKRALSLAVSRSHEAVKPVPPADLWEQMDKISAEANMPVVIERGPGMFTATEYGKRYGIHREAAATRLRKLVDMDKVERVGIGRQKETFYRIKS